MKWLVRLSIDKPKWTLFIIILITLLFSGVIFAKFSIDTDPSKSFSRKLDVIRYHHLTMKKFSMKDTILIGVENTKNGVFNIDTLRYVENVMNRIQDMTVTKTYRNIFTGKKETIEVPSEISIDDVMSIINADDVTVDKESNTIVIGNLTKRAWENAGLPPKDESKRGHLPDDDGKLKKLIPHLKEELEHNELYQGTLISKDEKACTVIVPIETRVQNKKEIIHAEIYAMVNEDLLMRRFSGVEHYFPHKIYNKTVDGTTVDDSFIEKIASRNRKELRKFYLDTFSGVKDEYREFYEKLKTAEVNEIYINDVFQFINSDELYQLEDTTLTYQDIHDDLYDFVIDHLDKFSRNNLESKIYSLKDVYDVQLMYDKFKKVTTTEKPENVTIYIAGMPVAEALLEEFVVDDMSIFLTITIIIIAVILFLGFGTKRGIILPLASVMIGTIWIMGLMLLYGLEFNSGTITIPSIIIAVGSAYIIHYLSRYYEEILDHNYTDVKEALIETTDNIQVAINLAAVTTISAFLSVTSSGIIDIKVMGILISLGITVTVILTYSFIPAILVMLPIPTSRKLTRAEEISTKGTLSVGKFTFQHSRLVFFVSLIVTVFMAMGFLFLKTESSMTYFFMEDNPIMVADKFINKKLTGTGQMNIVFMLRDRVNTSSEGAREELARRIDTFTASYERFTRNYPDLRNAAAMNDFFLEDMNEFKSSPHESQDEIEKRIYIFRDILNEYFEGETDEEEMVQPADEVAVETVESESLDELSGDLSIEDLSFSAVEEDTLSPSEEGINDIISRIGSLETEAEKSSAKDFIRTIRDVKSTPAGKRFQGKFYTLSDFFETDAKQPVTLRKIEKLATELKNMEEPKTYIDGKAVKPVGNIMSITDSLKLTYKLFYHDGNEKFDKIPDVDEDGFTDKSLTDRRIIGVCMNQLLGSGEDFIRSVITEDLQMLQFMVFMRSDKADFLTAFNRNFNEVSGELFPKDDPYVEKIIISGNPAVNMAMNKMLFDQQIKSIAITIFAVFIVCLFIFRSLTGGILSIIPITLTVVINLGIMGWLDFPINYSTVVIASIAIGAGIDYTLHFLLRFKYEHINKGDRFDQAYFSTLGTTGKAIIISAVSVAAGFGVLILSTFNMLKISGLMVALAMLLSATLSLTVLPALMNWLKPKFLERKQ